MDILNGSPGNHTSGLRVPEAPFGQPEYVPKEKGAVVKLRKLAHDPLERLVNLNLQLEEELDYSNRRRSGEVTELNSSGRVREFYFDGHLSLYDKLIKVNESLMKYAYSVPKEIAEVEKDIIPSFTVILSE